MIPIVTDAWVPVTMRSQLRPAYAREQRSYKLFNMNDQLYYVYKATDDISFFMLESTYPVPEQIAWVEKELKGSKQTKSEEAAVVGKLVAERAKAVGVERVVFDRAGFRYHGRIKSLADAAREAGLEF